MTSRAIAVPAPNETRWTIAFAGALIVGLPATIAISALIVG